MDHNLIIFYILIFIVFYGLSRAAVIVNHLSHISIDLLLLLMALIMVGIVYLLKKVFLDKKDNFYFEVSPTKRCDGGKYMYSSDPEKQKFCSQFSQGEILDYSCGPGFHGRPVHFERTPDSDDDWKDHACDGPWNYNYPKPL